MNETDCPTCNHPTSKLREQRLDEACQFLIPRQTNTMIVPFHGHIPLIKGDLSWLSPEVTTFLNDCARLMTPASIRLCNGSVFEAQELRDQIVLEQRNEEQKQLDRLHLSASVLGEDEVHVVTKDRVDADPAVTPGSGEKTESSEGMEGIKMSSHYMSAALFEFSKEKRFNGCMSGRTMYVVPFSMGCIGSRQSVCGVQVTDDPVLVLHLRTTFRVLSSVWDVIAATTHFIRSIHTIGMPRPVIRGVLKSTPPDNAMGNFIVLKHDEQQVWAHGYSFGRNYRFGKTFSVHACSWIGAKNGWLAENASILAITGPKNVTIHVVYSSLTSIDRLELQVGVAPGWKIDVLSQTTAWLHWHNGKLHAIAPENGEMTEQQQPQNLQHLLKGTPSNYQIQGFNPQNCTWPSDVGVPISAYIFANRRSDQFPLVLEANKWDEGVVLAAGIRVSAKNKQYVDRDSGESEPPVLIECPMLRVDSIHFSFAKYIQHWMDMGIAVGRLSSEKPEETSTAPPIFFTNIHQEMEGKVIWPGGVENARIVEYIYNRCTNPSDLSNTTTSGLGKVPKSLELSALVNLPPLLQINVRFWLQELSKMRSFFVQQMGTCLPLQLDKALTDMAGNL